MPYAGIDSIVGWAELSETSVEMDQIINLRVASFNPIDEALRPVDAARTGTFVLSLLIIIASVIITAVIARQITKPLGELTQIAERIREGEADVRATIEGRDEIGTLASTFNAMTTQLRGLVSGLEQTVEERTRDVEKRALQLETASEVAREAASIRDVSVLLERVTHLISDRFSFYHAGIFLLDQQKEYAILQAASSPGGFRMIERGHKLQVGKVGVVGFAAGEGQPRLAQDVGADVIYFDNPDMPDTRSELALPLKIRDEVIGVLDVQSREPNAFSREDVQILQTMADQIAVAIDNARLLQSSEKALSDLEALYGQESREAWQKRVQTQPKAYSYNPSGVGAQSPESSGLGRPTENGGLNHLTKNLIFRGEVIGSIDLARDDTRNWSDDELALVEEILEQTGLALENARLVEQIRLRSDQIQLLQEITAIAATLLDEKELLEAVTNRLLRGLELLNCSVLLFDASKNEGTLAADVFAPGSSKPHALSGSTLALENNEVTLEVIRTKQTVVLYDVPTNPRAKQIEALVHHKDIQSVAIVPLIIGNDVIGVIGLSIGDPNHRFAEEDLALLDQISAQVATAINVARLFAAEQTGRQTEASRAERERLVASITAKVRASNDPQEILQTAVNELREALGARQAQVLIEPDTRSRERSGATKSLDGNGLEEENQSNGRDEEETQP
jgi:GAF domain-containing protein/HAMP domain-containing protein